VPCWMNNMVFYSLLASTAFLTGLIWIVQLVHYPAFVYISSERFLEFHKLHSTNITFVVMPAMLLELALSIYVLYDSQENISLYWALFLLLVGIWASTFFLQVPLHNRLALGKDEEIISKLVSTNWIRTFLWSLRLAGLLYLTQK
jgi:hypothetical protein